MSRPKSRRWEKSHLPVTKAIRPLCVPIATTLAVFSVDSTAPHGPAAVLLLCLTTTPDYDCALPPTRIFPSRIKCLSRVKAQQRYASIPYFSSFVPSFLPSTLPKAPVSLAALSARKTVAIV
jgi:hypothetical protein